MGIFYLDREQRRQFMARKYFTKEEIELLSESKWVRKISKTSINFTKEFMIDIAPKLKTNSLRTILPIYGVEYHEVVTARI